MTSPTEQNPYERHQVESLARDERIGLALVCELVFASDEDRELAGKQTTEFLDECETAQLEFYSKNLDHLYAKASGMANSIGVRDVDIFTRAFMTSLEAPERQINPEVAAHMGFWVLKNRFLSQSPSKVMWPFDYDRERRLLFAGK